jgi:hypothetical protein
MPPRTVRIVRATIREQFNPLIEFITYIGADLKSTWELCKRALRHPYIWISSASALSMVGICIVILFAYSFYRVNVIGGELAQTSPAFVMVKQPVIFTHLAVLFGPASLCFLVILYSTFFTSSLISQIRARKRARLKTIVGQFNRDD